MTRRVDVRFSEAHFILIEHKARENKCTVSDIVREAVVAYLYKDVVDKDLMLANLNHSKTILQDVERKLEMFAEFFAFWLEYFFQSTPDYPKNKEQVMQILLKGTRGAKAMKKDFMKKMQDRQPAFLENLFFDFIEREGTEDDTN